MSHYQVEGGDECDWSEWERAGRTRGGECGPAVDSWSRYEEDALLARRAGANAFRFSISWSRIEPSPGRFDEDAIARYSRFVDALIANDLEPCVTLFHYTHPRWFHERCPWTSAAAVEAFGRFATRVAKALGDRVRMWVPLNEPIVFLLAAFVDGQIPPGIADTSVASRVLQHLLDAHAVSAAAIREANPNAAIGIAHNMMAFAPERRWNPLDLLLARTADRFYNRGLLEAFTSGKWKFLLPPGTLIRGANRDLPGTLDFLGVNFYSRLHLRCPGRERMIGDFAYRDPNGRGFTDNGWEICPEEFRRLLDEAAGIGLPLVVTENGVADATDRLRQSFLNDHVAAMDGRVAGYFHWSLLDNFEWLDGYGPRFGLYEVDRATMSRRPRASVELFRAHGARFLATSR